MIFILHVVPAQIMLSTVSESSPLRHDDLHASWKNAPKTDCPFFRAYRRLKKSAVAVAVFPSRCHLRLPPGLDATKDIRVVAGLEVFAADLAPRGAGVIWLSEPIWSTLVHMVRVRVPELRAE